MTTTLSVMNELVDDIHGDDLPAFSRRLQEESWLLDTPCVDLQVSLFEHATLSNRANFIQRLFDMVPAVLRARVAPPSSALVFALDYGRAYLVPLLTRPWRLPDDLPHAGGHR